MKCLNFFTWRFYRKYINKFSSTFVALECEAATIRQSQAIQINSTTLTQNSESMDMRSGNSPMPPPRQRHNPFNRVQQIGSLDGQMLSGGHHCRSHRYSSVPGRPDGTSRLMENIPRTKVTFRELHTAYGRRVLSDFNAWRHAKRQEQERKQGSGVTQELLITLWNTEKVMRLDIEYKVTSLNGGSFCSI